MDECEPDLEECELESELESDEYGLMCHECMLESDECEPLGEVEPSRESVPASGQSMVAAIGTNVGGGGTQAKCSAYVRNMKHCPSVSLEPDV
jgi:hypothetical protein